MDPSYGGILTFIIITIDISDIIRFLDRINNTDNM